MTERDEEKTLSEAELDADQPNELLARALGEAKSEHVPAPEWNDAALFARLENEKPVQKRSRVVWLALGTTMAAAAALALYVHGRSPTSQPQTPVAIQEPSAGSLVNQSGATVTASGKKVEDGYALKAGDALKVNGGNAVFSQDGKVRFSIESGSEVTVSQANAPLILALAIGATEADVTPVPTGDAFAVDLPAKDGVVARVAVHGTHLRVARTGDHVVVDLTQGVVSIGAAGGDKDQRTMIHAPAHVEFEANDAAHTVVIDRAQGSVRAADITVHQTAVVPPSTVATHPATHPAASAKPIDTTVVAVVDPSEELTQEVRSCIDAVPSSTQNSVTVESTLKLRLGEDGSVQSSIFDPPLPSAAQECAARAIYRKGLFSHGGDLAIRIVVRR